MIWSNFYRCLGGPYHDTDIESEGEKEITLLAHRDSNPMEFDLHRYRLRDSSKGDQVYVYSGVHGSN